MGCLDTILMFVVGGVVVKELRKSAKEHKEEVRLEEKRQNSWQGFVDEITEEQFQKMIYAAKRKVKRVSDLYNNGPIVYGSVYSKSGLSEWDFKLDFNDFGHLTGKYRLSADNSDSSIPRFIGNTISAYIRGEKSIEKDEADDINKSTSNNGYRFCPYCGRAISFKNATHCPYCGEELNIKN